MGKCSELDCEHNDNGYCLVDWCVFNGKENRMGHKYGETRTFKNGYYCNTVREDGSVYVEKSMVDAGNKMNIIEKLGISAGEWRFNEYDRRIEKVDKANREASICKIYHREPGTDNYNKRMKANAQLISSAPEMLEALIDEWKFIESYLSSNTSRNDGFWYNEFLNRQNKIIVLVEKATSKTWQEIKTLLS